MEMEYEDFKIDFPCPECQQKFQASLYQLFQEEVLVCPNCGATSSGGELSEINRALKRLERELSNLQKSLNNGEHR